MITDALAKVVEKTDLSPAEAESVMNEIMKGEATEAQIAAFLTALRMKGETVEEITSFAKVMREHSVRIVPTQDVMDTCGTGGDKIKTFNVSTTVAFVLAGGGIAIAKHGNRSFTSKSGSADVLEALGVNISLSAGEVAASVEKLGIGFMFAPLFHPAMKYAIGPRKQIKIRTVFNILGPLTNPFGATHQILGVYDDALVETMAQVLSNLGCARGFVVHGIDGLDEVSTIGFTKACEIDHGTVSACRMLSPKDFGLKRAAPEQILGGDSVQNAKITRAILEGKECGAKLDVILANASLGFIAAGKCEKPKEGVALAKEAIDSGKALAKLEALIKETNKK